MEIMRYSKSGFRPRYQSYHLKSHVEYHLKGFDISVYPEHLKRECQKIHEGLIAFYQEHLDDLQYGVWAFISGHKNNQSLNHLKERVPCWRAEIADRTMVVGVNWDHTIPITASECKACGFFIPESQMGSLQNIRRIR